MNRTFLTLACTGSLVLAGLSGCSTATATTATATTATATTAAATAAATTAATTSDVTTAESIEAEAAGAVARGDETALITYLETAAYLGDSKAAGELGELYQSAFNGYKLAGGYDYAKAMTWDTIAADMGNARGYTNLGLLYYNGWGVDKDLSKAIDYLKKADEGGDMKAPRYLGITYAETGDYASAATYYQKAADAGDITGSVNLAQLYVEGKGVGQSYDKAIQLLQSCIDSANGNTKAADAAIALGKIYEGEGGMTPDLAKAKAAYQAGADLGSAECKAAVERLAAAGV